MRDSLHFPDNGKHSENDSQTEMSSKEELPTTTEGWQLIEGVRLDSNHSAASRAHLRGRCHLFEDRPSDSSCFRVENEDSFKRMTEEDPQESGWNRVLKKRATVQVRDFCFAGFLEESNTADCGVPEITESRCRSKTLCKGS